MTPKKRKAAKIIGAGVVLILLITSPLMWRAVRQTREFNRAFQAYSLNLRSGNLEAAYSLADPDFKAATSYADFLQIHRSLVDKFGELAAVTQQSAVVEGQGSPADWLAVTKARLQFQRGAVEFKYSFHFTDGTWKLHGFERVE
jgi:hypothetical protein